MGGIAIGRKAVQHYKFVQRQCHCLCFCGCVVVASIWRERGDWMINSDLLAPTKYWRPNVVAGVLHRFLRGTFFGGDSCVQTFLGSSGAELSTSVATTVI